MNSATALTYAKQQGLDPVIIIGMQETDNGDYELVIISGRDEGQMEMSTLYWLLIESLQQMHQHASP
jgi:hypothetical protein